MAYSKIESFALSLAKEIAKPLGYDIYEVEYVKEGPHWFLRIYIERETGISLDDCEDISRALSEKLDEHDIIKANYFLEVSSPGLERVLRQNNHFDKALSKKISVKLKNGKEYIGTLLENKSESITLDDNIIILKQEIAKANIVFDFNI